MSSLAYSVLAFCLLVVAVSANNRVARQLPTVTTTVVKSTTTTTTATVPTTTVCVSFVNATTACRRRRNFWIDVPVILSLDDDINDFLEPSAVIRVKTTALPANSHQFRTGQLPGKESADAAVDAPVAAPAAAAPSEPAIASSINEPSNGNGTDDFRVAEPIYFAQLASFISTVFSLASTSTVTSTSTITSTVTTLSTSSTKTIVISGCSPSLTLKAC